MESVEKRVMEQEAQVDNEKSTKDNQKEELYQEVTEEERL